MVISHYTNIRELPAPLSSPDLGQTEEAEEALSVPNETSPLLQAGHGIVSPRTHTERRQSAISSFLSKNAGLLLIAASQFFFSSSNLCVKWLNSLDEQVPILEVRNIPGTIESLS